MEEYKGLSAGMKILLAKAEELGWWSSAWIEESQNNRTYVEMGQHSPAGEDFSMIIDFDAEDQCSSFRDSLESYYGILILTSMLKCGSRQEGMAFPGYRLYGSL